MEEEVKIFTEQRWSHQGGAQGRPAGSAGGARARPPPSARSPSSQPPSARLIMSAMHAQLDHAKPGVISGSGQEPGCQAWGSPATVLSTSPRFKPPALLDATPGPGAWALVPRARPRSASPRYTLTLAAAAPQTARRLPITRA